MKVQEMRLLVRVAETGSMTLAGEQLHLTPAAVSAAVQRLEREVGVRLFERTTRSLHPTDEGRTLIEGCIDVVELWEHTLDEVLGRDAELEGTIHLSAPADTTYQILEMLVVDLCTEHPKVRVFLHSSDAVHHLHRDAIDMAIRYGPLQDSTLAARKLADTVNVLVAAPAYLAERGAPVDVDDLSRHRCLTLQLSSVPVVSWQLRGPDGVHEVRLDSPLCGDGFLARRWALAGMGIAFKSLFDVIDDLEAGRLVRVLPDFSGDASAIHAVFPSRRFLPARVRALDEAITARFAARAARCDAWIVSTS